MSALEQRESRLRARWEALAEREHVDGIVVVLIQQWADAYAEWYASLSEHERIELLHENAKRADRVLERVRVRV